MARARTRSSSLLAYAWIKGSIDPAGANITQVSRAWSLVPASGEFRSFAIHAGTTRVSIGSADFADGAGAVLELSPIRAVPLAGTGPVLFSEARGAGLTVAELAAEARGSIRDGGAFSDEAGPQPASPARSNRLMGSVRQRQTGCRDDLDRLMPSGLLGDEVNGHVNDAPSYALRGLYPLPDFHNNPHR